MATSLEPGREKRGAPRPSAAVLRRLASLLRPQRRWLAAGAAALAGASLLRLALAPLAHWLVNLSDTVAGSGDLRPLWAFAGLILALFAVRAVLLFLQTYLFQAGMERLGARLREAVFEHVLRMPHGLFDRRRTGELLALMTADIPVTQHHLGAAAGQLVGAPLTLAVGTAYLIYLNWRVTLLLLVGVPLATWLLRQAARRKVTAQVKVQQAVAEITAMAQEGIAGARTLKAFGAEERVARRFADRSQQALGSIMKSAVIGALVSPAVELIAAGAFLALAMYCGYGVITGAFRVDLGATIAAVLVLERMSNSARQAGMITMSLGHASAAAARVFAFLDTAPAIADRPGAPDLARVEGEVEFERVTFAYEPDRPVLREFSLRLPAGRVAALVGRSGAGKSTLMALIPRFYDVTGGRLLVDGQDVRDVTVRSLRAQIAVVPQDVHLFSGSIRENIALGRPDALEEEIEQAARQANAHEFILELPRGYDTEIGERGVRLSGGQRQRLAIARALLRNPRILLLDEATASLDSESEALVRDALARLMAGRTTLVIAHRLSTVRHADEILVMDEGRIVERGTHEELLRRRGLYARMCETQLQSIAD
jgi:ATP-binding cassette, subfamily B, bacterial MsbA